MHARRRAWLALPAVLPVVLLSLPARADELRVLAAGAAKQAIETLAPAFERATGHVLRASFDTVGAQRDRVLQAAPGQAADVVVLSDAALQQLQAAGRMQGQAVPMGRVSVALAVPAGQPVPALATAEQLRAALLAAPSIAYADPARGATAGTHFARTLDALGVREAVAPKATVLPFGVDVIEAVAQGRFALGVSQSSEISGHPGVRLVGPLPPPHAQVTGYAAARVSDAPAAQALLDFLRTAPALDAFRASGFADR
jgi:molybdate transport system substrate-binding protein